MSKIITIFSNPGQPLGSMAQNSVAEKLSSPKEITAAGHVVDEENFAKSRHVGKIFDTLNKANETIRTAQNLGIITDSTDSTVSALHEYMSQVTVGGGNGIVGAVEITDAQYNYLQSNPEAMEVFINNAAVGADNLSWDKEKLDARNQALEDIAEETGELAGLVELTDNAYDDDYPDDYDELDDYDEDHYLDDYDDLDDYDYDYDDDELDDYDDDDYLDDGDISPRTQVLVMSAEDLERYSLKHKLNGTGSSDPDHGDPDDHEEYSQVW